MPVWGYEFADRGAPFVLPDWLVGLDLGAYHASELAYVFGTSWVFTDVKRFTPRQKALSDRMQRLWAGFGQGDFGPEWPRVEVRGRCGCSRPRATDWIRTSSAATTATSGTERLSARSSSQTNRTVTPGLTLSASIQASQLVRRTQPCEAVLPTRCGSGVPWMP